MHFMPDTEDEDAAAEAFWPEGYKQVIREDLRRAVAGKLDDGQSLKSVYEREYTEQYGSLSEFTGRLADMLAIGAENGADDIFDDIVSSFLHEAPLPPERPYARYIQPDVIPAEAKDKLGESVLSEYSKDNIYVYAYGVGYKKIFPTFDDYIKHIARMVVTGAERGADDMLGAIYRSFLWSGKLPPARRRPRRLKTW